MHQMKRMSVYEEFCEKQTAVLFATDIAARGLDFPNVDWVIQMDCPDDPSSYIHRAGRTARYQKGGESLLMLLPSEEAMVEQLAQKKIPIQKIEVNPSKLVSIQRKLEAMLARDVELKQMAQRAFVTYAKSVFLMKDKSIFDVTSIDLNALARSLGLALAPRVRFLQKHLKATESAAPPQAPRMLKPNYDTPAEKPIAAQSTEQQWRRNDLEAPYDFHAEDELQDSDSDDGIFKIKRQNHALPGFEEAEEEEVEIGVEKKKKEKILTKEKVAKRILAKKLKANKIVNFDDEGNVIPIFYRMIPFRVVV
jgi:ATP-dependent RNA helicase DDX10/DBP4